MHKDCGKCPASISCHNGILKDVVLCPRCGIFQVTLEQVYYVEETKTADHITWRIKCPVRFVEEGQRTDWNQESDEAGYRYYEGDNKEEAVRNEVAALQARILIPDKGPPQKQHSAAFDTSNKTWIGKGSGSIPVALCNDCYGGEHVLRVP